MRASRWRRVAAAALLSALSAGAAGGIVWSLARPSAPRVTRNTLSLPREAGLTLDGIVRDVAISADGGTVVYVGGSPPSMFLRPLDRLLPVALAGTGPSRHPALSPDGQWVAFFDNGNALKKTTMSGGAPVALGANTPGPRGLAWVEGDAVVFATFEPTTGLLRVSARGGEPEVLTRPDRAAGEFDHLWPEPLPGGTAVLFTVQMTGTSAEQSHIAVFDLRTKTRKTLTHGGSHAQYVPPGYLVFGSGGTLRAVRFDARRLEIVGTPVPVLDGVNMTLQGAVNASVSADGTLVYVAGGGGRQERIPTWVDRQGRETPVPAPARVYVAPRLSPDGARLALHAQDQDDDLWLWDDGRRTLTRATFDKSRDYNPVWTADGRRLIWASLRDGRQNLYSQLADGTGSIERLTDSPNLQTPTSVTPDGSRVLFQETRGTGPDLMLLALDGTRAVTSLLATPAAERNGEISADGRWLAYESDESGQVEIYVRPFPNVDGGKWQVSTGGGTRPAWARYGRELFYRASDGAVMAAPVTTDGARFQAGTPVQAVAPGYATTPGFSQRPYDVSPDGRRFLMLKSSDAARADAPSIVVVQHWVEELKRIVGN